MPLALHPKLLILVRERRTEHRRQFRPPRAEDCAREVAIASAGDAPIVQAAERFKLSPSRGPGKA